MRCAVCVRDKFFVKHVRGECAFFCEILDKMSCAGKESENDSQRGIVFKNKINFLTHFVKNYLHFRRLGYTNKRL